MRTSNSIFFVCIAALLLTLVSCEKEGPAGPEGPQGEQGAQGIQGEKGADGSTIFSGTVTPPANLGAAGDFYFRTSTSDFYGPKTAAGWGTAVNLRGAAGATGATGQAGAAGSKILSGTGAPAANVGAIGDYYLRTSNATLYGPKAAAGWGTTFISLRGATGAQGEQGPRGATGATGARGATGATGATGTANVIYSNWFSFQQAQRDTLIDGTNLKVNHLPAPQLTQTIIDNGMIQVYMRFGTTVLPLPYTSDAGTGTGPAKASTVNFIPRPGRLFVTRYTHDNSASLGFGTVQFRYILIPGGIQANASLQNINMQNYEAVRTALNLPD